jgi:subtilisin family serine protease
MPIAPRAVAWLAAAALVPAAAQVTHVPITEPFGLTSPVSSDKGGSAVYIVKLRTPGAASYKRAPADFSATKPNDAANGARAASADAYAKQLEQTHDRLLAQIGARKLYSYRYSVNGFAAELTAAQVSRLAQSADVEHIWQDSDQYLQTNNSSAFLGLQDTEGGLRADVGLSGENVVVGIIDSGVAPQHPSLLDTEDRTPRACRSDWARTSLLGIWLCTAYRRNPPTAVVYDPPVGFTGACQAGDGFAPTDCNNKIVGARYYIDGFLARHELDPGEFRSPKDVDGHGTHIATIVAGNSVDAHLLGTRVGRVNGIAPRARLAIYKACWLKPGDTRGTCTTSDLVRAIDDAVADGVDLINYSVGSLETDLDAPDDLALLDALDAGVLTVVAAGNDGPDLTTIGSPSSAPWVLTTAASTLDGEFFDEGIEITAPADIAGAVVSREASFTPALSSDEPIEEELVLADDNAGEDATGGTAAGTTRDACQALANAEEMDGRIALIERGGCEFQVKIANAEDAGAIAVVVYHDTGAPIVMNGDSGSVDIPAVMISNADGEVLVDRLVADAEDDDAETDDELVSVRLARGIFASLPGEGNVVADFSSRGPSLSDANILKPDVTAPGVDILGGQTPDVANGLRGETYQYMSGTSQSAPEVTGVAALLKEAHPGWSPSALKSALMTTAYVEVVNTDGEPADAFDMGAGHIDANRATDPGLVYDSGFADHAAYLCGLPEPPFPADQCATLASEGFSSAAVDLNLPSIAVAQLISGDVIRRRVTNVGPPATFTAEVLPPPDLDIVVEPSSLVLGTGQAADFTVTFVDGGAPRDLWYFGELAWRSATHDVESPIAVRPATLRATPDLFLTGREGTATLPIGFGYDGTYSALVHGLHLPTLDANGQVPRAFVDDDATNTFSFRNGNGVTQHAFTVPAGQLVLRVALFDELTDGEDDLDLFLFYCPSNNQCSQVAKSDGVTSDEQIDIWDPDAGSYVLLVHGFETDQVAGGPGANYSLFTWALGTDDVAGNLSVTAPAAATNGTRVDLGLQWSGLDPGMRYLGAISHNTPLGRYDATVVNIVAP